MSPVPAGERSSVPASSPAWSIAVVRSEGTLPLWQPIVSRHRPRFSPQESVSVSGSTPSDAMFGERVTVEQVEEGHDLAPESDAAGLIPCVTTDYHSGEVLMVAVMNREALAKTIETGEAHYWSRSGQGRWHKGATSGLGGKRSRRCGSTDDQDCVWLRVEITGGGSCHVGCRSCFYRKVPVGTERTHGTALEFLEHEKAFDPKAVDGDAPNPTQL